MRRPGLWRFVRASPWVGRGRAQVIAVNVLLPFAAAAGVVEAAELFERLPGEPTNRVVRYMAELLGGPDVRFRGACQQQGLLHLFKADLREPQLRALPGAWRRNATCSSCGPPQDDTQMKFRGRGGRICNPRVGQNV